MNGASDSDEHVSSFDASTHHELNYGRRSPRERSALRYSGGEMHMFILLWSRRGPSSPHGDRHIATMKITRGSGPMGRF